MPPNIQRMRADDLAGCGVSGAQACPENLEAGDIEIPNHPLIREVMKDVLTEAMDVDGLERVLRAISPTGRIQVRGGGYAGAIAVFA